MEKIILFKNKLNQKLNDAKEKKEILETEKLFDEAVFESIKINVTEIFVKMLDICEKKSSSSLDRLIEEYLSFLNNIPKNWISNLEYAKQNEDFETVMKEEIKLQTKESILQLFNELVINNGS